jgi:hypothetical protein
MTHDEERAMLLNELQYRRARLNEAMGSVQRQFHYMQEILQATIEHMEGNKDV